MKNLFMTLAVVMCCAIISSVFTACSSDDDKNSDNGKAVAAVMNYMVNVGDDVFAALDLTIEYYDANGQVQSEQMTAKNWKKTVQAKLPATLGARLKMQVKSSVNPATLEKFTEDVKYSYSVNPVNARGIELSGGKVYSNHPTLDMPGDKVTDWVERHADGLVKFLYVFDANGQVTESSWQ